VLGTRADAKTAMVRGEDYEVFTESERGVGTTVERGISKEE